VIGLCILATRTEAAGKYKNLILGGGGLAAAAAAAARASLPVTGGGAVS
jgi:hypothetical protein